MIEEIKTESNCIIKAFEKNSISILEEEIANKKIYCFKANDIGKALKLSNIAVSIQNYDDSEKVLRKAYDLRGCEQDTAFLTSHGVYRLLYNSKKPEAKKFRDWVGDILDDIIFNESKLLKEQLKKQEQLLLEQKIESIKDTEDLLIKTFHLKCVVYLIQITATLFKFGFTDDINRRLKEHKDEISKDIVLVFCIESKNNTLLENKFKEYLKTTNVCTRQTKTFKTNKDIDKKQTELIELNLNVNLDLIKSKLVKLNENIDYDKNFIEKLKLENEILKLKMELKHINTEKDYVKIEKINNDIENNIEKANDNIENKVNNIKVPKNNKNKLNNMKEYYEKNKEEINKKRKEKYEKNKDVILQRRRENYEKNKDVILQRHREKHNINKENYEKNKEEKNKKQKEHYEKNKDKILERRRELYNQKNLEKEVLEI